MVPRYLNYYPLPECMKTYTFTTILELFAHMRAYVDTTGVHIHRDDNHTFNVVWKNDSKDEMWEIAYKDILNDITLTQMREFDFGNKKSVFASPEEKKIWNFVVDTIHKDNQLLDQYINYGPRILDLLPFS
jgi:hypothetical protein